MSFFKGLAAICLLLVATVAIRMFDVFGVQETITAGIHFSDYEQMKMDNKSLDEKLEERNEVSIIVDVSFAVIICPVAHIHCGA